MLDTLMALWNQDRRKRAMQVLLTFFLMCIGISLLFIVSNKSLESQKQQKASIGSANPTVPTFGNTVVPDLTPTVSVVVGTQPTPGAKITKPKPAGTNNQPIPVPTTAVPCASTPSGATSQTTAFYLDAQLQSSPTPRSGRGTPSAPAKHFDGGGGPINTITPVLSTPTPVPQSPSTPVPAQHGWVSNCGTSNNLSSVAGNQVMLVLARNIWLILGSALLSTTLFYAMLYVIKRRMQA